MVRFDDEKYKRLSSTRKRELMDKYIKKADEKIADIKFFTDLVNNYKSKLQAEKSRN